MARWAGWMLVIQLGAWGARSAADPPETLYTEAHSPPSASVAGLPDLTHLAAGALPAVVGVLTSQAATNPPTNDSLRDLYDKLHDGPRKGVGSGFLIHRDGWVVTNAHVVEGADKVEVEVGARNTRLPGRVVGVDSESDLALLKVDAGRPLPYLPLGDSDELKAAQWVLVIGSPFGLDHSVSFGIVSNTGRTDISPIGRPGSYDFVQTDASINPGNSGGPVIDLAGRVVAIATAVNATGQGIGFAIPINMAKTIIGQLRSSGRVVRSWMGVSVKELPPDLDDTAGVEVTDVASGGPAQRAGVRSGDVITTVQGHTIRSASRLRWYVSTAGVGNEVALAVRRPGEAERTVRVVLAQLPGPEQVRAESRPVLGE
ncbi:MAG TPA: trypsin-like peptidase domain-containing protein [Anaeromyxobacter sp.]|nr:trypsin-like peptidase domain-containing protein [Anaeromyxobacter sp.]